MSRFAPNKAEWVIAGVVGLLFGAALFPWGFIMFPIFAFGIAAARVEREDELRALNERDRERGRCRTCNQPIHEVPPPPPGGTPPPPPPVPRMPGAQPGVDPRPSGAGYTNKHGRDLSEDMDVEVYDQMILAGKTHRVARAKAKAAWVRNQKRRLTDE